MKKTSKIWRVVLPLGCMIVLTAVLLLATAGIQQAVWGAFEKPVADMPSIAAVTPMDMSGMESSAVSALSGCYDAGGTLVAYRMETSAIGFNSEVPITLAVTVSADGKVLRGIEVLSQKESEYYGARIKESSFQERFTDRYLPIYLTGQGGRGAHIDGLSGATVTSSAVVNAVNTAGEFVTTYLAEGE